VHDELVATLGAEEIAYITMTNYVRAARIIPRDVTSFSAATSPHIDESDEAIPRALEDCGQKKPETGNKLKGCACTFILRDLA
jgi:hypothetical protein